MKKFTLSAVFATGMIFAGAAAYAEGTVPKIKDLVIEGQSMTTIVPAPSHMDIPSVIDGWEFRAPSTQALEVDDFENPGMISVDQAKDAWTKVEGAAGKSCASCHQGGPQEFAGLRTVLPRYDKKQGALWAMEDYINYCRTARMQADPWKWGKADMNAMVALITVQSRGMPMNVAIDGEAAPFWKQGKDLYYTQMGQLGFSCASCHEKNYGNLIRAEILSQGQTNAFPSYRLKNAHLNSVENRFKGCMGKMRAEPFAVGGPEFHALELYVASRGAGLSVSGPSVRN